LKTCIVIIAITILLTGCGGGFSCKNSIGGVNCETITEVYDQLQSGEIYNVQPKNIRYERSGDDYLKNTAIPESNTITMNDIVNKLKYDESLPLAKEKKKVAIWIAPWVDQDGDLHKPEMVYSEIEPQLKWNIGELIKEGGKDRTAQPLLKTKNGE